MASLKSVALMIAPALWAITLAGCPVPGLLAPGAGTPADLVPTQPADNADSTAATEKPEMLADLARDLIENGEVPELARSQGSTSISTDPGTDPGHRPPADTGADYQAGGGPDPDDDGDDGSDPPGGSGGSGESDGDGAGGGDGGRGGDGEVYSGEVQVAEHSWVEGVGEGATDYTERVTITFDAEGIPDIIPLPVFAYFDELWDVDVRFKNETAEYYVWMFDVTVTVVSATYTPTMSDVVLDVDVSFIGAHSSIIAAGVHELHMEVVGDSVLYESHTHYDGHFRAGDLPNPDWEADATEDFDCTGTLARQ